MTSQLVGVDFTNGSQLPNYVNGRLLTADDLATSQATLRTRDRRLGHAVGSGVVDGLWVTAAATTLSIAPGLAVAASGDTVTVGATVTLPLTFDTAATTSSGASFTCCTPATPAGGPTVAVGCYLLTALPACQLSGSAPMAAPRGNTTSAGCAAQWQLEGVQFKAIPLPIGASVMNIEVTPENRRTLLAHWCLGTAQLAKLGADLFNFAPTYAGLDTLDPADLTPADMPLAVFYWNGQALDFVDNWSVRRTITGPDPLPTAWSGVLADRRRTDGQARLMQFQDQAADVMGSGNAGQTIAARTFPMLPPVGFLPIGAQQLAGVISRLRTRATRLTQQQERTAGQDPAGDGTPPADTKPDQPSATPDATRTNLAMTATLKQLDQAASALTARSTQPGYNLETFFSTNATYGGILDWDLADFALRQSWETTPAVVTWTSSSPTFGARDTLTGGGERTGPSTDGGFSTTTAPLTWYLVLQNVTAGSTAGAEGGTPTIYIVFIKNTVWSPGNQTPFITGAQDADPLRLMTENQ